MLIIDLIHKHMTKNGFDGLTSREGCSCTLKQGLFPCGTDGSLCHFGYVCPCEECDIDLKTKCPHFYLYRQVVTTRKCKMRIRQGI